jgi:EpsI family protein
MPRLLREGAPALFLLAGIAGLGSVQRQTEAPLRMALDSLPAMAGLPGADVEVPEDQRRIAGVSSLVLRAYPSADRPDFTVYVGYYEAQSQGRSIHSPKNCLPGAGWEPMEEGTARVAAAGGGAVTVNRYVLARGANRALVYYWYQGRGRVAWNEYAVKWDLLRDKARDGRSEEALVRIVVPLRGSEAQADSLAGSVAAELIPAVDSLLPLPARS